MLNFSSFKTDVTPPVGVCSGFGAGAATIRDPLFARGIILDDMSIRIVLVSLDYCVLVHSAYEQLRTALAKAAGTPIDRVIIHCIHQHDAPLVDLEAVRYLDNKDYQWWPEVVDKCIRAVAGAVENFSEAAAIGTAAYQVDGYASNRRITMPDGSIAVRYSRCADENIRNAPVGAIDPALKTVAFRGKNDNILSSLSFYATHPQVANTGDKFSADAPGEAMRLLGDAKGLPVFFTGCGGNVTAGKYSGQDTEANLLYFGKKLADAINANLDHMQWQDAGKLDWQSVSFEFPRKRLNRQELLEKVKANPNDTNSAALLGAMDFGFELPYTIYKLKTGSVNMFFLPGELFVEYQLYINSLYQDSFVTVAANCRDDFFYCPTAADFKTTGGYETNNFCYTNEEFEPRFKAAAGKI